MTPSSPLGERAAQLRHAAACVALICAFPARPAEALDPAKAITQYVHDVWQTEQGLPQNSVYASAQTRDGYLWLGTQEGLVRFDGARFVVFDQRNTPGLASNLVLSLVEDRAGRLFIGTGRGLVRYENGAFIRVPVVGGGPDPQVKALCEDGRGRLWVGTLGDGLLQLDGSQLVRGTGTEALAGRRVQALAEDREGALWVGTEAGLARVEDGALETLASSGLSRADVTALYTDRAGSLWIGTTGGGLGRLDRGRLETLPAPRGVPNDSISAILEDRDGNLWVGARGGLNRLRDGRVAVFTARDGLSSEFVFSIQEDREGSLWIGTGGGGLNRLRNGRLTAFTTREGLANDFVRSLHEGRDGSLWIGTDGGGASRLKDGRLTGLTTREGLSSDFVERVFEDSRGALWIGTSGGGLDRWAHGRVTALTTRHGLANDYVTSICEGRDESLWVGTRGGLSRLKNGRWTSLTTRDGLTSDLVRALFEDREGALWIGTEGGGLNRLRDGRLTALTTRDGLSSDNIVSIQEDGEGNLWIGTRGGGLVRLRGGALSSLGTKQGLFDDSVFAVLEGGDGQLWMSSNKGIFRASKREIEEVMDGRRTHVSSVAYGRADGMKSPEGNGSSSSGFKTRDGRLWFGTIGGAVVADPLRLPTNSIPPPVHIEEVLVDGGAMSRPSTIQLPPGTRTIELHYTAASLLVPQRVQFKYMLEGYDPDWVDAGTRRTAYYTGVPHGAYRFHVIASNDDGVWNEEGASLRLTVGPRLIETTWFRLGAALAFAGVIYGSHRLRVLQLRSREAELVGVVEERTSSLKAEKERTESALREALQARKDAEAANRAKSAFLATMSHELRTPLNAVLGFAQLMERRKARDPEDLEHLGIIGRSGEHLLGLINDVLSLSKIEAGSVSLSQVPYEPGPMLLGLVQMLGVRARAKGLDLGFESTGFPAMVLGDEGKLRQILLNLLTNAVKFTTRGEVTLRADWAEGQARFTVEDTGPGLTAAELAMLFQPFVQTDAGRRFGEGTGLGLTISRSFARLMGGDITVTSTPGKGTSFFLTLPLPEPPPAAAARPREDRRRVVGISPAERPPRVLIVDDVPENRLLVSRQLSSIGLQVVEAAGGEEAIARWRSDDPDLILMDVRMPGVDGLTAARAIRAAESEQGAPRPVKIIALSASVLDEDREHVLSSGCDDFLAKPFREGALFDKVARLLSLRLRFEDPVPAVSPVDEENALTAERLARISAAPRERLREAVRVGDDQAAALAVDEIHREDPRLAEALARALREFQFDTLLRILEGVPA